MATSESIRASLLRAGFEDDEIPALLGNIDVETGGSFDYRQVEDTSKEEKGYGLFQFTGGHLSSYLEYLKDTEQGSLFETGTGMRGVYLNSTPTSAKVIVTSCNIAEEDQPYYLGKQNIANTTEVKNGNHEENINTL